MSRFENHAGFNITNSKLQVVEINFQENQYLLENVDEAYFNEPVNLEKDKETKISALLQGAFDELLIKKRLNSRLVSFTLPFDLFHCMQAPYDNSLLHQDLLEEFRWEFSVLYPYVHVQDLVIQYIEIEKNDFLEWNTTFVIGLPRKYLRIINNFCTVNSLKLRFIDHPHLASERALASSNSLLGYGLVLSVYFNNKHLSLIFLFNGKPIYFKHFPLNDAGEIPAFLLEELQSGKFLKINKSLIQTAFISGDETSEAVVQSLKNIIGIDFVYFNPFEKIKPVQNLFGNKCYSEKYNSFAPAAGIAFRIA